MSYAQTGLDPKVMGLGPVSAVTQALAKAELSITQVDLFELNEAFAAQALGVVYGLAEQHAIQPEAILEKANVNGGAIALGHPLGHRVTAFWLLCFMNYSVAKNIMALLHSASAVAWVPRS